MIIPFFKYHGAGNDFVIIDQRSVDYISPTDQDLIEQMCDRRFGIGADGLMLIVPSENLDFEMVYFNSDGRTSSMCGNGGRCIVSLAHKLGMFEEKCTFEAIDGQHESYMHADGVVALKMNDVHVIKKLNGAYILDTGSPHYVCQVNELENLNVVHEARKIRYNDIFKEQGINVNFIKRLDDLIHIRTYERGVEDETLACGTGVVAAAIASTFEKEKAGKIEVKLKAKGGHLDVTFIREGQTFTDVWLIGPATFVFEGHYDVGASLHRMVR